MMRIGQLLCALCVIKGGGVAYIKKANNPNLQRRQIEREILIEKKFLASKNALITFSYIIKFSPI